MSICYVWTGSGDPSSQIASFALCVTSGTPEWIYGSAYPNGPYKLPAINGVLATGADGFYVTPIRIKACTTQADYKAAIADSVSGVRGNCSSCLNTVVKYDCLNGNCVPTSQYNTPGTYQSLADCQAVCANGGACAAGKQCVDPTTFCPNGKVCIEEGEYSSIQALISKLNSEVC